MLNIGIEFNLHDFEYDVYSLVKAFYPACEVKNFYTGEETAGDFSLLLKVICEEHKITVQLWENQVHISSRACEIEYAADRTETKNALKQLVYRILSEKTGKTLPWGTLTGIRPTKIPMHFLEQGWKNTQIAEYMRSTYGVSREKTALAITIANREKAILQDIDYENG